MRLWLEQVFAGQDIPRYEFNIRTIDILYDLSKKNLRRDRDTELVIEDLQQKTSEYAAEGKINRSQTIQKLIKLFLIFILLLFMKTAISLSSSFNVHSFLFLGLDVI